MAEGKGSRSRRLLAATQIPEDRHQGSRNPLGGSAPTTHPFPSGIACRKLIRSAEALGRKGFLARRDPFPPTKTNARSNAKPSLVTRLSNQPCVSGPHSTCIVRAVPWFCFFRNPAVSSSLERAFNCKHSAVRVLFAPVLCGSLADRRSTSKWRISARCRTAWCFAENDPSTGHHACLKAARAIPLKEWFLLIFMPIAWTLAG